MNNPDHKKYEYFCIDEHRREFKSFDVQIWNNIAENDLIDAGWVDYLLDRKLSPSILRKNRIATINPYCEYGVDGIARYKGVFHLIQVKYYDPRSYISVSKLKTFVEIVENLDHVGYLYHIGKVGEKIKSYDNIVRRSPAMNSEYSIDLVEYDDKEYDVIEEDMLWDHQKDIFELMMKIDFSQMKSLELCPGGGKTDLTGVFIKNLKKVKYVIVFNQLISFVDQNNRRLIKYIKKLRKPYVIHSKLSLIHI